MRILGIDPGLANCGWGVISLEKQQLRALAYGSISTTTSESTSKRLGRIFTELQDIIERYEPTELGIETIYQKGNLKSAMATAQARGAALAAASALRLNTGEYTPAFIKKAVVGTGSASKEQIQYMVRAILGLDHTPSPDHAADALAAAICHAHSIPAYANTYKNTQKCELRSEPACEPTCEPACEPVCEPAYEPTDAAEDELSALTARSIPKREVY